MSAIIGIFCILVFAAGVWCYGLAFHMPTDTLSILVFFAGILLNSIAFFIPWQIVGHGRK